ncbi:hypothetical protein LOD99_352 [Oopsacas minuta]|uniref:ABC transmembrane type-1 domain-containing protein n=1 Tax=Oopsacas minuta TaxID=111878 RepID=A0AAV7KAD7_9METZ|nr:hypothetical protein LOD99_352 [Oopsacas minuta]
METKYNSWRGGYRQMSDEENTQIVKKSRLTCCCGGKNKSMKETFWYYWILFRTMYPSFLSNSFGYTLILIVTAVAKQVNIYNIGLVPSTFYLSLLDNSREEFKNILWEMCILVITVSLCVTTESLIQDLLALTWRFRLTNKIQLKYFQANNIQNILHNRKVLDNPDQRITQDIYRLTKQMAEILVNIILKPFIIIYYTYQVWISVGWLGVVSVYSLFILSVFINKLLLNPVVNKVIRREQWEGDFRFVF